MKVLNVVSPPKKPTVINNFTSVGRFIFSIVKPKTYPIKKQPRRFATNVPTCGIPQIRCEKRVTMYLNTAPKPPPMKIAKISFNINFSFSLGRSHQPYWAVIGEPHHLFMYIIPSPAFGTLPQGRELKSFD